MSQTESLSVELRQAFIRLIAQHTGLEIRERDRTALSQKIFLRMKALKLLFPLHYYQLLESKTLDSYQEWQKLIIDLTNLESYFFRDKEQFNLLRNHILPELIQRKQDRKTIRICSAGCSTGEEPYSLAILLKELIPNVEQWNLTILGIDINQDALEKAQIGIYRAWSFRTVDPEIKQGYFKLINHQYQIVQPIKEMVKFEAVNLVNDPFPQPNSEMRDFDLIICRNVFIYFDQSAIAKVLDKFYLTLQPLGYLITGHAELHDQNLSQFQTRVFAESLIYQRQADHVLSSPSNLVIGSSTGSLITQPNNFLTKEFSLEEANNSLQTSPEQTNINLQQAALNLLKQLPPDTKIAKLGNLTAAELILQVETALKLSNGESK